MSARIVVVDNYDSFTWNLVQLLYGNGREVVVRRNDEVDAETLEREWASGRASSMDEAVEAALGRRSATG